MLRRLVIGLALIAATRGSASADPLGDARAAVAASDYVAARPALTAALSGGGRSPDELAEIYRLTGIVDAALGDAAAATAAFTRLLALDPKAALPAGTSPKLTRPFDAAARYYKTHAALALKVETATRPPTVTLVVVSDPLGLVAKARVAFVVDRGAERTKEVVASERTDVALPAGRRIDARVVALDSHGNRLVEIGSREVPIVIVGEPGVVAPAPPDGAPVADRPAAPRGPAPSRELPVYRRWWPYAGASAVVLGAAGYFAWSARGDAQELERLNADSANHQFREARSVEDRARRSALFANLGLGVAGALAVVAGVMYVTAPTGPRDHGEPRLTAIPVAGGGALVYGGTF